MDGLPAIETNADRAVIITPAAAATNIFLNEAADAKTCQTPLY